MYFYLKDDITAVFLVNGNIAEMKAKVYTISIKSKILSKVDQFIISKEQRWARGQFSTERKMLSGSNASYPQSKSGTISNVFSEHCRSDYNLALRL